MTTKIDLDAVRRVLAEVLRGPITVTRMAALSGGASAETWAIDVTDAAGSERPLILRRSAGEGGSGLRVPRRIEALTQRAAGEAGVPVANVLAIFDDDPALGSGYVMERLEGETIPRKLLREARFAAARAQLAGECGGALAAIHRVPLAGLPALPALAVSGQLAALEAKHRSFGHPVPAFSLAFRLLRERLPPPVPPTLVHGDFRTGNLLVDERGLVAVLDWELVHLGDPLEDLGWFCTPAWRFGGAGAAGGFTSREVLYAAYEQASGRAVDRDVARFWELFGTLRWGVICEHQVHTHLGGALSVERAAIGRRITEVELDLLLLMDGKL